MSVKKQFVKTSNQFKVTFKLTREELGDVESVKILGDFNNWNANVEPMKLKSGEFTSTLVFEPGTEQQFKYLADDCHWFNEIEADKQVSCGIGVATNSVLVLE